MLAGGGAPTKDNIIIKSLIKHAYATKPLLVLVDASHFMLESSLRYIYKNYPDQVEKVDIRAIELDILKMGGVRKSIGQPSGNVAWFLTGGTLGNLHETKFLESVSGNAEPNDWLVLGVPCYDGVPSKEYLEDLENEYEQEVIQNFAGASLRAIWSHLDVHGRMNDAKVKATAKLEDSPHISSVPEAIAVVASVDIPGHGVFSLFRSSRYKEAALITLAKQFKWDHLVTFNGPDMSFKQIVFCFQGS